MTYPTRIDLCDGKYSVIYNLKTGQSECLRYGLKWRDLCGDKMVLAMFDEIVELRTQTELLTKERDDYKTKWDYYQNLCKDYGAHGIGDLIVQRDALKDDK